MTYKMVKEKSKEINEETSKLEDSLIMKKHAVMLFRTKRELGLSKKPNQWMCEDILYFDNGTDALLAYANTKCPASQLISAEDDFALQCKCGQMILNYNDEKWLNENLYPFL